MNFNSIRVRYTALICGIALVFVISMALNFSLINKLKSSMSMFSENFNPAISAVLNADRDLYQARVAELQMLNSAPGSNNASSNQKDFEENAQQALDRMRKYKRDLAQFPNILNKLSKFDGAFNEWKSESTQVFTLVNSGQLEAAKDKSSWPSLSSFEALREFYDMAGEAADIQSKQTSEDTRSEVAASMTILSIVSFIIVAGTLVAGFVAPKTMSDALDTLSLQIQEFSSGDGDLSKRLNSKRKDEIGQVANDLDALISGLAELIRSIVTQSGHVIDGVNELNKGANNVKTTSEAQLSKVDMIVTAVNEMSYAVKEVAENANQTSSDIEEVSRLTLEGQNVTNETVQQMEKLSDTVSHAADVISNLAENSSDIASVLDVIRGIAEQTNLLALNAAIEAARAGEQGRGFAVVADEVRTLASRTQESTASIQQMIQALQTGVEKAVASISQGTSATESTVELSQKTLEALDNINAACVRVSDVAAQTATATEQQSQVAGDISHNLTELSDDTKHNYDVAENNGHQADQTFALANELSNSVTRFKLD